MSQGRRIATLVGCVIASMAVVACSTSVADDAAEPTSIVPATSPSSTTTTQPPTTTTTEPPPPPTWGVGAEDDVVLHVEQRLAMLGYRPGDVDGRYSPETASAVMAFQKHEGLTRDGVVGPEVLSVIDHTPTGGGPRGGAGLEVDLDRQIMFVVALDGTYTILNVSTGSNESYRHPGGYTAVAVTPTGTYAVGKKIDAEEHAPLGTLYRPMYFHGGYAVHGSRSVPAYPASHGCVRVSYEDEDWLFPTIRPGTPVTIYGGGDQPDPVGVDPAA
jgi:hypothetical protein